MCLVFDFLCVTQFTFFVLDFERRVEYTTLAKELLSKRWYMTVQLTYQASLAFNNMAMIIQTVQIVDWAIAEIAGRSCATPEFYPRFRFHCPKSVEDGATPFGDSTYVLSIGFIITALVCAPLGYLNLDDNIIVQRV